MRKPPSADVVPFVPWGTFLPWFRTEWNQGEHVSLFGPTGTGKTVAAKALLPARLDRGGHVVVFGTKPADDELAELTRPRRPHRFKRVRSWPAPVGQSRVLLWPTWTDPTSNTGMAEVFRSAMASIFRQGSWTVVCDEVGYLTDPKRRFGLEGAFRDFWQQGRSLNLTMVGATQRPAWVPLDMYSAPTHVFFWRTTHGGDLKRMGDLNGTVASTNVRQVVSTLERYETLYVNTREGTMLRTRVER